MSGDDIHDDVRRLLDILIHSRRGDAHVASALKSPVS